MIYLYRILWLIGNIPLFVLEGIMFLVLMFTYPIVGAFYFIKTGDVENIPYLFYEPVKYIDNKYCELLKMQISNYKSKNKENN